MSRAPGKYVAGTMAPAGAALDRPGVGVLPPHLRTETDPVSETLCSLVFRIADDGQSAKPQ
jgi:hypothetical protein